MVSLPAGAYTVPVTAQDGGSGMALVEAYELERSGAQRWKNLSTRVRVSAGAGVAIPGIVVEDDNARTLLVRAVGPGLGQFGVAGTLARPALVLRQGNRVHAANAGWEMSADAAAVGAAAQRAEAFALGPGQRGCGVGGNAPGGGVDDRGCCGG